MQEQQHNGGRQDDETAATLEDRISELTSHDAGTDPMEANLRQILNPDYTFFDRRQDGQSYSPTAGRMEVQVNRAMWCDPRGQWDLLWHAVPGSDTLFNVQIEGSGTRVSREHLTAGQAIELLRVLKVLPRR